VVSGISSEEKFASIEDLTPSRGNLNTRVDLNQCRPHCVIQSLVPARVLPGANNRLPAAVRAAPIY
jgi:hypothetical protein